MTIVKKIRYISCNGTEVQYQTFTLKNKIKYVYELQKFSIITRSLCSLFLFFSLLIFLKIKLKPTRVYFYQRQIYSTGGLKFRRILVKYIFRGEIWRERERENNKREKEREGRREREESSCPTRAWHQILYDGNSFSEYTRNFTFIPFIGKCVRRVTFTQESAACYIRHILHILSQVHEIL